MSSTRKAGLGLAMAGLGAALIAMPAHADTTLSSSTLYNYHASDGYDTAVGGTYDVVPGASFDNNGNDGLHINSATLSPTTLSPTTVNITGGDVTNNSGRSLFDYGSTITLYGDFSSYGPLSSDIGSFTGRLQNDATSQTFSYHVLDDGTITLVPAAVPEPSSVAGMGLGLLGLGGLMLRARKRRPVA